MKAMVLAAGRGSRLKPLTDGLAKPLAPVANIPIIRYNLEALRHYGIQDVVINLHHLPKSIEDTIGDGSSMGLRIRYSREDELLGTGGGVKQAMDGSGEAFVLINSDILIDVDLGEVMDFHRQRGAAATMVLLEDPRADEFGAIEVDDQGQILRFTGLFDCAPPGSELHRCIFTGVHILEPRVLEYIPPGVYSCINQYAYPKMLQNQEPVLGYLYRGPWFDLGTIERYWQANMDALHARLRLRYLDPLAAYELVPKRQTEDVVRIGRGAKLGDRVDLRPPVLIGDGARIGNGATIGPHAIVGLGCTVGENATIARAILWPDTKIKANEEVRDLIVHRKLRVDAPPPPPDPEVEAEVEVDDDAD